MSLPWTEKTLKAAPVANDEVMILDSEDTNPDTINKRATLLSLPSSGQTNTASNVGTGEGVFAQKDGVDLEFKSLLGETDKITLTGNTDDITFTLGSLVVTTDQLNTYTAGFKQSFVSDGTTAGININTGVPSTTVTGDIWRTAEFIQFKGVSNSVRTVVITDEIQTLTDKTIDADDNTISNLALGTEVTGASTDLTDSSNIARLDTLNDFTVGTESLFFRSESGSPADTGILRLARIDDIVWRNQTNDGNLLLEVDTDNFLTFDSFFIAATATQGTSGDVLTSNGVGLAPTFQDATSGVFPVADDVMIIEGSADPTKQLQFEVDDLISSGVTRTVTAPNSDITLVDTSDGFITNSNLTAGSFTSITGVGILTAGTWNADLITVSNGGTGAITFTTNGVLVGNGTGAIASTSVGTSGDVLTSNGVGIAPTFQTAGGLPVPDTTSIVEGSSDATKQLRFDIDGFTTITIRVLTPPDADGTIVLQDFTQTLTNKTLTAPVISTIINTGTLTLPVATDTLVGRDTTDIFTNKTLAFSSNTISGTTTEFNTALSDDDFVTINGTETITGVKTFGATGNVGKLVIAGTTSGTTVLDATAVASGTLTLPAATDTLVGKATSDIFTNKTFDANATGNSLSNVDVSDLADATDGELITWDASGVATTVAVGTSGQLLTSNGVGTAPTFQTPARAFVTLTGFTTGTSLTVSPTLNSLTNISSTDSWVIAQNSDFTFVAGTGDDIGEIQYDGTGTITALITFIVCLSETTGGNDPMYVSLSDNVGEIVNTRITIDSGADVENVCGSAIVSLSSTNTIKMTLSAETANSPIVEVVNATYTILQIA